MKDTIAEPWTDRNATISAIRAALKRRSGKAWSVTGGRGTAYGWITIDAPPARRTAHHELAPPRPGCPGCGGEWVEVDTGKPGGNTTSAERDELAKLLGLDRVHHQGVSVPASYDHRREYIDRAEGRTPSKIAQDYWD